MSEYIIYNGELYHFGVKGMKWGVRRYQDKNGRLTTAGKKRYSEVHDLKSNEDEETTEKNNTVLTKKNVAKGAAAVGISLAVIGGMYLYSSYNYNKKHFPYHTTVSDFGNMLDINKMSSVDTTIKSGSKFYRVSSKSIEDYAEEGKRIYVSHLQKDRRLYKAVMPSYIRDWGSRGIISDDGKTAYEHIMTSRNEIKIPSQKMMAEAYMRVTGYKEVDSGKYKRFAENLCDPDNANTKKFFSYIQELGYNAVIDDNDKGNFSGGRSKMPLILLNPKDDIQLSKSHKLTKAEKVINLSLL